MAFGSDGIPISFLGSFCCLGGSDASINMVSLFAYIITLGLVVDDAIIVGENIFEEHERGTPWLDAAVKGARQMTVRVLCYSHHHRCIFPSVIGSGCLREVFKLIPTVVICVLILSLIESFFILPSSPGSP